MLETLARSYHTSNNKSAVIRAKKFSELHSEIISKYNSLGNDYAAGKLSPDEFWTIIKKDFPQDVFVTTQSYILDFQKNEAVWALLPSLKEKYRLNLLSDCPEDKARLIREKANLSFFEKTYFSYEYRLTKEDERFFEIATKGLGLSASECLFIDDSTKNIDFARRAGLQTVLYTDAEELKKFFADMVIG